MYKIASVALTAALGVGSLALSVPAEADSFVGVGVEFPRSRIIEPFPSASAYYGPYYYAHGLYWRRDYDRDRDDRFHPRWDRDRHHHWDRR